MFETQTSCFVAALTRSESPIMRAVALLIGRRLFDRLKFPKGPANLSPPLSALGSLSRVAGLLSDAPLVVVVPFV